MRTGSFGANAPVGGCLHRVTTCRCYNHRVMDIIFPILEKLAKKLAEKLFLDYAAGRITDGMTRRRFNAAKERITSQIIETAQSFLEAGELSDDDFKGLVGQRKTDAEHLEALLPDIYPQHAYDPEKVLQWSLEHSPLDSELKLKNLDTRYVDMLRQVIVRIGEIVPLMREWERLNWVHAFTRLERIEQNQQDQKQLLEDLHDRPDKAAQTFEERLRNDVEGSCSQIELRGIRGVEVLKLPLDVAYVNLALCDLLPGNDETDEDADSLADLEQWRKSLRHQTHDEGDACDIGQLLADHQRLVIVGEPGCGKSTLCQYLAYRAARREIHTLTGNPRNGTDQDVPFLFRVRSLDFDNLPQPDTFLDQISPLLNVEDGRRFVAGTLDKGRALIFLDGLDECQVPPEKQMTQPRRADELTEWDKAIAWLGELLKTYQDIRVIVTARPSGYTAGLLDDLHFTEARITPLSESARQTYVRNWSRAAERSGRPPAADTASLDAVADARADNLLERIQITPSIRLLAATPLMLSVLCLIHRNRGEHLPQRRVELLRECVDVLLYEWHRTAGVSETVLGKLDALQQRTLLEPLAWLMLRKGKAEYPRNRVERIFKRQLPSVDADAPDILNHIRDRTGVLVERRPGVFAFAHLILQEYLAAEHAIRRGPDTLLKHADDPNWAEVIPMAAGTMTGHEETLVRALRDKEKTVLAGRCTAAAKQLKSQLKREIADKLASRLGLFTIASPSVPDALLEIGGRVVVEACLEIFERTAFTPYDERLADRAANLAADVFAERAADRAANRVAELAAYRATDRGAYRGAYRAAYRAAYLAADQAAGRAAYRAADILAQLGTDAYHPVLESVKHADVTLKLFLLSPLAELITPETLSDFFEQFASIARTQYPLRQLALCARLHHRVGQGMDHAQREQLMLLFQSAYHQFGLHYIRLAKTVDTSLRDRGKSGITEDWSTYETQFMAAYEQKLNKRSPPPPGWQQPGDEAES